MSWGVKNTKLISTVDPHGFDITCISNGKSISISSLNPNYMVMTGVVNSIVMSSISPYQSLIQ